MVDFLSRFSLRSPFLSLGGGHIQRSVESQPQISFSGNWLRLGRVRRRESSRRRRRRSSSLRGNQKRVDGTRSAARFYQFDESIYIYTYIYFTIALHRSRKSAEATI